MTFTCRIGERGEVVFFQNAIIDSLNLMPVARLRPGDPVSRSCTVSSHGSTTPHIGLDTNYTWLPPFDFSGSKSALYKVVTGMNSEAILVPDSRGE